MRVATTLFQRSGGGSASDQESRGKGRQLAISDPENVLINFVRLFSYLYFYNLYLWLFGKMKLVSVIERSHCKIYVTRLRIMKLNNVAKTTVWTRNVVATFRDLIPAVS